MSEKQSGFEPYSSTTMNRDQRFKRMVSEISRSVVGPMPVSEFLNRFLRPETLPKEHKGKVPSDMTKSLQAYVAPDTTEALPSHQLIDPQVAALQPICSNFEFRDTHKKRIDTFQSYDIAPEVCVVERSTTNVAITEVEIMMELKSTNTDDPFVDESKKYFVKNTASGKQTLGQTTLYAAAHQAAQFRTHVFSVLVFSVHARLLRWDRSGVIVTEALPIVSEEFIEFFQLYDQATPARRGIDTSVTTPSPENTPNARDSLRVGSDLPLVQLTLGSSLDEAYIVSRDTYMDNAYSPLGRSTRTFTAYSTFHQCNVFLKDSWRLVSQTPEHEIYAKLYLKNVPHLPTVVAGGDIFDQTTLTQDVLGENPGWIKLQPKLLRKHRHYRLILKEIATPLSSFSSTKILLSAVRDAIKAHRAAYFNAAVLHCDISSGNIMIYNGGGLLIDWDLSKSTEDKGPRETGRTGTWQLMACRLLEDPTVAQDFTDDVESFVHVLTYVSFQYAKHNLPNEAVLAFLTSVYDCGWTGENGLSRGGHTKIGHLIAHSHLNKAQFENSILKALLIEITEAISIRYLRSPSLEDADGDVAIYNHLLNAHKTRLGMLEDSEWIISEFASALESPNWPANDEVTTHTEGQPSSSKRKSSEDAGGEGKKPRALT